MGRRRLPSGGFQARFQHRGASSAATYPTRELAEDAEPRLRTAVLTGRPDTAVAQTHRTPPAGSPSPGQPSTLTPDEVRSSSAAATASMDTVLTGLVLEQWDPTPAVDDLLATSQGAALLGVPRPTLVAWLEAGRIPFRRCGTHRRVRRSHVLAFREQIQRSSLR